jgi:RimJ/RimL family protein N-acetyltransferase
MQILYGQDERVGRWVCARTGGQWMPGEGMAIGLERDGDLVAGVMFDHYNGRSIAMHVAGAGMRWCTRAFRAAVFGYPFLQLKVAKVLGLVDSTNLQARRFDEHLGFRLEARIADAAPSGDLLIYSMTAAQCRHLEA